MSSSSDEKDAVKINADRTVTIEPRCIAVLTGRVIQKAREKDKKEKNGKQKD